MPFTSPVGADFGRTDPFGLARISQNALQIVLQEQNARADIRRKARAEARAGIEQSQQLGLQIARQGAEHRDGLRRDNQNILQNNLRQQQLGLQQSRLEFDQKQTGLANTRADSGLDLRRRELDRLDSSQDLREREFDFNRGQARSRETRQREFEEAFLSSDSGIDAGSLNQSLQLKVQASGLNGFVPKDGDKFGIKTGSPEEWANFMTGLAHLESSLDPKTVGDRNKFTGDSNGLFQLSPNDAINWRLKNSPFTKDELFDPELNSSAAVSIMEKLVTGDGVIAENGVGAARYWGPLRRGVNPTQRYGQIAPAADDSLFPGSVESEVAIAKSRVTAAQSDFDDARQLGSATNLRAARGKLDEARSGLERALTKAGSSIQTEDSRERDKRLNSRLDQLLRRRKLLRDDGEPEESPLMLQIDSEIKNVSEDIRGIAPGAAASGGGGNLDPRLKTVLDAGALRRAGSALK